MNKIELAKLLGLEIEFEYCDGIYGQGIPEEMEFTIGGKYFEVEGSTKEEC